MKIINGWIIVSAAALAAVAARADVTIQQKNTLDVFSLVRAHGASTTSVTADKERRDGEFHCEGVMSLVCGNLHTGDIVRLDRSVTWTLEPDKKRYRETPFLTPEQMAAMRAKMQANLEKMRSCPVSQKQQQAQPVDQSKCQMSPPKIDVQKSDEKMSIAGHDTQRTSATLTETCTDKESGDVCDTVVAVDVWLTQETLPGSSDRRAFDLAYAKKLGLEDPQSFITGDVAKYLAPYQSQIKLLQEKSAAFKGQPLKTSLRVLMGGPQCSAINQSKSNGGASADNSGNGAANPLNNVAQAGKALGGLVGGLFHKKKADDSQSDSPPPDAAPAGSTAAVPRPDPFAQYQQMAAFSQETVAISTDPIGAERFNVPADWTKEVPVAGKSDDEFSCPKT
jgi:hypothetical protein